MRETRSRVPQLASSALIILPLFAAFALLLFTCGKKAGPSPPIPVVPVEASAMKVEQAGSQLLFSLQLPAQNTDYKTPLEISRLVVYRLKDVRIPPATQTQTAQSQTAQSQTQKTAAHSQTQTAPQTQTQTLPTQTAQLQPAQTQTAPTQTGQTQSQKSQTQTAQSQTQSQPAREEQARAIPDLEFDDRAEKIAEIPGDAVAGYLRDNSFIYTDKINTAADSEDYKYWYYYALKIYNKKGKTGGFTQPAALFPSVVPVAPKGFNAILTEKRITLTWNAVTADINGKPLGPQDVVYNIYRGTTANFAPVQPINPAPLNTLSYDDTTFQYGQSYYYFARARLASTKKEQDSDPSNVILMFPQDTFPPSPPQELNVVAAREGMVLIWAPNAEEDVAGYNIYRSLEAGKNYQKVNKELIRETTFTDPDIQMQQKYYYVVTAVDNAPVPNESPQSAEVSETKRHQ